jgi:hypothetical protein
MTRETEVSRRRCSADVRQFDEARVGRRLHARERAMPPVQNSYVVEHLDPVALDDRPRAIEAEVRDGNSVRGETR